MFKDRIKQLRQEHNLTQYQMSQSIGVAKITLQYYENGKIHPSPQVVKKICEVFDVDQDWILDGTEMGKRRNKNPRRAESGIPIGNEAEFIRRFKALRLHCGYNKSEFAKYLGIDRTNVFSWEAGHRMPSMRYLERIAEVLDVPILWLQGENVEIDFDIEEASNGKVIGSIPMEEIPLIPAPRRPVVQIGKEQIENIVASRIYSLRSAYGFNLTDFSKSIQVAFSTVRSIEFGIENPSFSVLRRVCDRYHVTTNWLFDGDVAWLGKEESLSTTGERIKWVRYQNLLTQQEFAESIGKPREYVCSYEAGRVIPDMETAKKICKEYGVGLEWLIG